MSDFLVFKPNNEVSKFCFIFAVEAGRVVVVKGRQLASEHGSSCSLQSPGMRLGEARLGGAGGAETGDAARSEYHSYIPQ